MSLLLEKARQEARCELSRRYFWDYCQTLHPGFYKDDRPYLRQVCDQLQWFVEQNDKRILVLNMPPRHGKSRTATTLTSWLFGDKPWLKIMTGSYNETLSTTFAKTVRDTIGEQSAGGRIVYNDIFPATKIKYGEAAQQVWALDGYTQKSYLATSPTGTATGFGANILLLDDIIKNSEEAYNEAVLDKHWDWFVNTMLSRTEGDDWKIIVIMTRWATNDLAGRILSHYPDDVVHINYKAVQDDGTMLCPAVLNAADYELKTREMNSDIVAANYQQEPIDVKGRLYDSLMVYEQIPADALEHGRRLNYTDTADKGTDWLCSVDYIEHASEVYVTDIVMSDAQMEVTEPLVADMLVNDDVTEATVESNNGGRGFGRNVTRLMMERHGSNKCTIIDKAQTSNKEARILSSSAWVKNHVYLPQNYQSKYADFYKQVRAYQRKGKNKHDDAVDVLAGIYEQVTGPQKGFVRMSL